MTAPRAVRVATASAISGLGNAILWYCTGLKVNQGQFNGDIDHDNHLKADIMRTWGAGGLLGGMAFPIVLALGYMLYVKCKTTNPYHNEQTPLVQQTENKNYFSKCWPSLFNRNEDNDQWPEAVVIEKKYGIN